MTKTISLLFPNQLFSEHELYETKTPIYLVEEHLFFKEFQYHKIKLAFHRATMKCHEAYLKSKGLKVQYIDAADPQSDIRQLIAHLAKQGIDQINCINPTDNWLEKRMKETTSTHGVKVTEYENPAFLNTRSDLETFFKASKKKFYQTSFYKTQREKYGLLLAEDGGPLGGKWSYDAENRKPYPKDKIPPEIPVLAKRPEWEEAVTYVQDNFPDNPGNVSLEMRYPITAEETGQWLEQFFQDRFHAFGDYEDAIHQKEAILHHSVLSPMMNAGLIRPMEVIRRAMDYAEKEDIPMNSLEGFVRQIIGWREFIRGMYEVKGSASRTSNFWNHQRRIPDSFYTGTTGIVPVDITIKQVLKEGYCHHIERLMVLGNFMLLCEFHPDEVYRWFMELFIDAYDWVMVPNVYGMSQFADGGFFATKPYISSSNYIMKMSNHSKGDWQKTWDGLFWHFMDLHRDFFLKNPRLSMLVRTFDKMSDDKKTKHLESAAEFLDQLDQSSDKESLQVNEKNA